MLNCQILTGRVTANKSKHLLIKNKLKKVQTLDSNYFIGSSHFKEDGTQNYLVFQYKNTSLSDG